VILLGFLRVQSSDFSSFGLASINNNIHISAETHN